MGTQQMSTAEMPAGKSRTGAVALVPVSSLEQAGGTATKAKPSRSMRNMAADGTLLVTFLLKEEEFGFDIMSVQEIIRLPKMARLPQTPEFVEGVFSLRGAVLPIFDIRARFGMERAHPTDRSRVLVVDIEGKRTGLLVDAVRQVTRVARNEFEPPSAAIRNETADYIDGVVKLENGERIIIALDAAKVCSLGEREHGTGTALEPSEIEDHIPEKHPQGLPEGFERQGGKVNKLVSFQIGHEEFAFPMEHVREILRVSTPKEVPSAPSHLLGVLTVRGNILPIVDLRRRLGQTSFAEDHVAESRNASSEYRCWIKQNGSGAEDDPLPTWTHSLVLASESLRKWLSTFNSSSQTLMESLAKVRNLNDQVQKQTSLLSKSKLDREATSAMQHSLFESARLILPAMEEFEQRLEGNIREDQRIIVVDSSGFQLGLVVDHVNEVLGVSEADIEPPPQLASSNGVSLAGIAKLDDGNRLILLLETTHLIDHKELAEVVGEPEHAAAEESSSAAGPRAVEAVKEAEELQLVTFMLGQEEYGIPIERIQEIDRLSRITQTAKAPKFVEGITNLRGEVIPVLSTRTLFALESRIPDDRTRVIIVDMGGVKTGMVVDSVKQVLTISKSQVAAPPASISVGANGQFISGIGMVENGKRMLLLLDVARVLNSSEHGELEHFSKAA